MYLCIGNVIKVPFVMFFGRVAGIRQGGGGGGAATIAEKVRSE